jgi:hypothetical protein
MPRALGNLWRQRKVAERTLQASVERLAETLGWIAYHIPANVIVCERCGHKNYRAVQKGFPDLCLVPGPRRPPRPIRWIELKAAGGSLTAEQRILFPLMERAGSPVAVLTLPRDEDRLMDLLRDG